MKCLHLYGMVIGFEAMKGYNDDLTMSFSIGLWVRDTALRLRQEGIDLTKKALGGIGTQTHGAVYGGNSLPNHLEHKPMETTSR